MQRSDIVLCCKVLVFLLITTLASADSLQIIEYDYDKAGHLTGITDHIQTQPPSILTISPAYIHQQSSIQFTVSGNNLAGAKVSTSVAGLTISNVSTNQSEISFDVSASQNATLGQAAFDFFNRIGNASKQIEVLPPIPVISVFPAPIAMLPNAAPLTLDIHLSRPDIFDHTFSLSTLNPAIASITPTSFIIPAGQTRPSETVQLSSHALGTTNLNITATGLDNNRTTVFVTKPYVLITGEHTFYGQPLGIVKEALPQPQLIRHGPFVAQLTVFKQTDSITPTISTIQLTTPNLGVNLGSAFSAIAPQAYLLGADSVDMVITGLGLEDVNSVEIIPEDGITLGLPIISNAGDSVTVSISIAEDAEPGVRQIILATATETIIPESPQSDRIFIAEGLPQIDSIDPIIMTRGNIGVLTVRGINLTGTETVSIAPSDDVTFGSTINVNSDGTELTLAINIDKLAAPGIRIITVKTLAGESSLIATEANTLVIDEGIGNHFPKIVAPKLGIIKGSVQTPVVLRGLLRAPNLGIAFGTVITGLSPAVEAIGSSFVLTIQGHGLQDVDTVNIEPSDGITLGLPTASADGKQVTVELTIAADAPQIKHKIIASANDVDILPARATATQFAVTGLQPQIDSVTPNFLLVGEDPVTVIVNGRYLNDAQTVEIIPDNDISVGIPTVNSDGSQLTVTLVASVNAETGRRLLKITTPGGETSDVASPTNTVTVASEVLQLISPVYAPLLGIHKQTEDSKPSTARLITSPLLGINKQHTLPPIIKTIAMQSAIVGITRGTAVNSLEPNILPITTAVSLEIIGTGLDAVERISFNPDDGIVQTAPFSVTSDAKRMVLPIKVGADVSQNIHQIILHTATGTVSFASATTDRLNIIDNTQPRIISLTPIQEVVDSSFSLLIRGLNLGEVTEVVISPADGIILGTPEPSADGAQLTVQMVVAIDAEPGPRVITVNTPTGSTTINALPANTFTVVSE